MTASRSSQATRIAIIGAGPTGLIAAERLSQAGCAVTLYDRMASPGRKFLMAGRGGLNLTHSEALERFLARYGAAEPKLAAAIKRFPPDALRRWSEGLGQPTFVGSSGRVFPTAFKASPLLRAWAARLKDLGVMFRPRHRWLGWAEDGALRFREESGQEILAVADATILALGGASWPRLGSDGSWVEILSAAGVEIASLRPANCGFEAGWSPIFAERFAGEPLKPLALDFAGKHVRGEAMITAEGIEGGAVYALAAELREAIAAGGSAQLMLDLKPDVSEADLLKKLALPRRRQSFSTWVRKAASLSPVAIGLLREIGGADIQSMAGPALARLIKALPLTLTGVRPIDRAISTAGGVRLDQLDERFMLRAKPGVFAAGEMLDWEAPTGGYLLQACFSTGMAAADGALDWLERLRP
jgi:uncharacterized flavoprotein (TIGR03862 family)